MEEIGDAIEGLTEDGTAIAVAPSSWPLEPAVWPKLLAAARELVGQAQRADEPSLRHRPDRCPGRGHDPGASAAPGNVRISQLDKDGVEHVGLVKIDLLSNRALSTLAEARNHLQALAPEEAAAARRTPGQPR